MPKLDDFKKDQSPFSGIETRYEKATPEANGIQTKFEKKSRRNKNKRAGVLVTSAVRTEETQGDEEEDTYEKALESARSARPEESRDRQKSSLIADQPVEEEKKEPAREPERE